MTSSTTRSIPASITGSRVSVLIENRWRSFDIKSLTGQQLVEELKKKPQDYEAISKLADTAAYIVSKSFGRVVLDNRDQLRLDGEVVDFGLAGKLHGMIHEGFDVTPLTNYIERVARNPNKEVAKHLHAFIIQGELPFAPDGRFYAWKNVRDDYFDHHSGKVLYQVGTTVSIPRESCNETRQPCKPGLHACSYSYLPKFMGGKGRAILLLIDPEFVTSIPEYSSLDKLRCCKLDVVADVPWEEARGHLTTTIETRYTPPVQTPDTDLAIPPHPAAVEFWRNAARTAGLARGLGDRITEKAANAFVVIPDQIEGDPFLAPLYTETFTEAYLEAHTPPTTADDVIALALEAGKIDGACHSVFDPDADYSQNRDDDWSPAFLRLFDLHYLVAYVEHFQLDEYHSEKAMRTGAQDGDHEALNDIPIDRFDARSDRGEHYGSIPFEHDNAYAVGFVRAYIAAHLAKHD